MCHCKVIVEKYEAAYLENYILLLLCDIFRLMIKFYNIAYF